MSAKLHPIYLSEKKMFKLNAKFYSMVFAQIIRLRTNKRRNNKYTLNLSFFRVLFSIFTLFEISIQIFKRYQVRAKSLCSRINTQIYIDQHLKSTILVIMNIFFKFIDVFIINVTRNTI